MNYLQAFLHDTTEVNMIPHEDNNEGRFFYIYCAKFPSKCSSGLQTNFFQPTESSQFARGTLTAELSQDGGSGPPHRYSAL